MAAEHSHELCEGTLGRYALFGEIASGGMATVHIARLLGSVGFARTVAIKRLHPHLAKDPELVGMFLEEARLAVRVRHSNVVSTLDVVSDEGELFLVMEYLSGESLSRLVRKTREAGGRVPPRYTGAILCGVLDGLHAAHEATSDRGEPLGIVHRDVSPQNVHVGVDGVARVLDFGIAKATNRFTETRTGQLKGKVSYMAPEQLARGPIDRRADIYSASVVLWEALTGARLFKAEDLPSTVYAVMNDVVRPPSALVPELPPELDAIVMRGLERDPTKRWATAREMAIALEEVLSPAAPRDIGGWVEATAGATLAARVDLVQRIERQTSSSIPSPLLRAADPVGAAGSKVRSGIVRNARALGESTSAPSSGEVAVAPADVVAQAKEAAADEATGTGARRSSSTLAIVALLLLVSAAIALGARLVQLRAADTHAPVTAAPPAAAPADDEKAITLELSRSASAGASAALPPPPPPPPAPPASAFAKPRPPEPKPDLSVRTPKRL